MIIRILDRCELTICPGFRHYKYIASYEDFYVRILVGGRKEGKRGDGFISSFSPFLKKDSFLTYSLTLNLGLQFASYGSSAGFDDSYPPVLPPRTSCITGLQ